MSKWDKRSNMTSTLAMTANRRSILKSAAAVGAMAFTSSRGILPAMAEEAIPKKGGHFKLAVAVGATTDSLDPAIYSNAFTQVLGKSLHGYMTEIDADGKLNGEIAESWEASKDAKTWTFKLRQGVEFHNGKSLDADDVIASINYHRGEESKSAAKSSVEAIEEIRADGAGTVVIVLKNGNADFPYLLEDYHLAMVPAKEGKADVSGVGSGGYVLESVDFGVKGTAKRFANYWKKNAAWVDSYEILAIHDATARTTALTAGEIHAMERCELKTVSMLETNKDLEIVSIGGTQHYTMPMHCDVAPFDNPDVRLALKYAIDRKQLLDILLLGYGQIGNDHPIASTNRFFNKNLPQREFDPEKAKFHLKNAGLADLKVSLSASDGAFPGGVDAALLYQQTAAKAGITVDVVREPSESYWNDVWLKKPFCQSFWGGRPTADWMFSQAYAADAAWNESHWKNPRFNELLVSAQSELDDSKRLEMYSEMQTLCSDDGGTIIPVFANYVSGLSKKVGHSKIASNWDLDGFRCIERWWLNEA